MPTYRFDCGCEWPILGEPSVPGGLPLLDFDVDRAPQDCPAVWDLLARGLTYGLFQLESPLGRHWTKKLRPECVEHLSGLGAALRPGCLESIAEDGQSMTAHFCMRKNGEEPVKSYHPVIDQALSETFNILLYQEESMDISRRVAGFNLQEADQLRKCVTADTMFVSKSRGWISIERLLKEGYEDDLFLIMDEKGCQSWKGLEKIWSTGKHGVRKVLSSSGSHVWSTKYHQFLTDSGWKARSRLVKQDRLVAAREIEFDGEDRISSDLALVVAGIIAEGYFVERSGTFVNHDEGMMRAYVEAYTKLFGEPTITGDGRVALIAKKEREFLESYINYGLSDSRRLPDVMMGMTKESTRRFLSYLLACEGGVSEAGQFEFSSKSPMLPAQVKLLLLRFGVRSLLLPSPEEERYRLYVNDVEDQKRLLSELTGEWPGTKREALERVVGPKANNFTTDTFPNQIVRKLIDQYPMVIKVGEGGSVYSKPISRLRLARLAELSGDPGWVGLVSGRHWYDELKDDSERKRQVQTFDFTVAGGDTPYIIANGLVIHNSIGKKLPEEMAKCKVMFLEGAEKARVLTKDQAEEVFGWIEKSQRYSFCHGHALSYALTSYDTAYIKAHFPLQFFTAWLYNAREKQQPYEEVANLVNDAKLFDIDVLPPDLRDLRTRFYSDGMVIKFGLSDIRGVGLTTAEKVVEAVKKIGERAEGPTWFELLSQGSEGIPHNTFSRLIEAGALDWLGMKRKQMAAELEAWTSLTTKERAYIRSRDFTDLYEALRGTAPTKKEGGGAANKNRTSAILSQLSLLENPPAKLEDTPLEISYLEEHLLGVPITFTKIDTCDLSQVNVSCKEFLSGRSGFLVFGVEVKRVRETKTKRGKNPGSKMAFLTISDSSCALDEVVCFPDTWKEFGHMLEEGKLVFIQGERGDGNSLSVKKVWPAA